MAIADRVREFVIANFYVATPEELTDGLELVTSGIVDSTGLLEVISFLEAEFGIRIDDREMLPENLGSIARIAAFVARKQGPAASAAAG